MAKCIKMHDGPYEGKEVRVPDDYARRLVREGRAHYVPKEAWKISGREYVKGLAKGGA